jgi:hypothetical protein
MTLFAANAGGRDPAVTARPTYKSPGSRTNRFGSHRGTAKPPVSQYGREEAGPRDRAGLPARATCQPPRPDRRHHARRDCRPARSPPRHGGDLPAAEQDADAPRGSRGSGREDAHRTRSHSDTEQSATPAGSIASDSVVLTREGALTPPESRPLLRRHCNRAPRPRCTTKGVVCAISRRWVVLSERGSVGCHSTLGDRCCLPTPTVSAEGLRLMVSGNSGWVWLF